MTFRTMHRKTDHPTSTASRRILPKLSKLQRAVLNVLRRHYVETADGMTDLQLEQHELIEGRRPSTIRKRRLELQRMGYVTDSGRHRAKLTIWIPVDAPKVAATVAPAEQRHTFTPRKLSKDHRCEWTAEDLQLLEWFQANREQLPNEPFQFYPGANITDTNRFYESLAADIRAGPASARARGGLQYDLAKLKSQFSESRKGE